MHWKNAYKVVGEEGGSSESATCPVCSVNLRRGVSLQDHLNTHPKQEVIEALVRLKNSIRESFNLRRSSIITPAPNASVIRAEEPDPDPPSTVTVSVDEEHDPPKVQITPTPPPNAHQVQITSNLPPNTGSHIISFPPFLNPSAIPQFISLPIVTGSNSSTDQASMLPLLYNPFIFPSNPHLSTELLEGIPPLQFLASNNLLRPFQIIQACANSSAASTSGTQLTSQPSPIYSDSAHDCTLATLAAKNPMNFKLVHEPDIDEDEAVVTSEENSQALSSISIEKSPKVEVLHDDGVEYNVPVKEAEEWSCVSSPDCHSVYSVDESSRAPAECTTTLPPSMPEGIKKTVVCEPNPDYKKALIKDVDNTFTSNSNAPNRSPEITVRPLIVHLASKISRTGPFSPCIKGESSSSETSQALKESGQNSKDHISTQCDSNLSSGVDGLHFLVPSHFLENPSNSAVLKGEQSSEPISPHCDSSPASPYQKSVDSPTVPLNIQTDETMPPRGELSEQESIGGNSSSMWSVPPYQMTRELLSPVVSTSFDLTARESWAGSDISDCEGNANQAPDSSVYKFSTTPSFSNTIPALLPKTTEGFSQQKVFCSSVQGKGKGSNNPPKPRVYKCKACTLEFACPKERRVHPCEKKKEPKAKTASRELPESVLLSMTDCNNAAGSSTECAPIKPKRKYSRKPKAADVKKENIEVRPSAFPHISEVGSAGHTQVGDIWPSGQFSDLKSMGQSQFTDVFHNPGKESKDVEESDLKSNYQSICTEQSVDKSKNSGLITETCAQTEEVTFMEVTPALLDDRQRIEINNGYLKVKRCTECDLIFSNGKDLSRHLTLKHKINKYQCTTCGESFDKESTYFEHLNVHPLECRLCGKCFHRRKSLNLHMKWHMDVKPYKCNSCEKSFVTRQKLDEHQNTHTGNAPIKCPFCNETFRRYSNLIQHKNRHHLNLKRKVKDFICHCGEVFQSKKKLEWHKEIHDSKPKCCPYCNERFVHTSSLTRHVRKAHDKRYVPNAERDGENVECPICHRVFLKASLVTHIKVHSGERPFSCHICGKDFTTKWNLQHHKWTHASRSSKPFKCTLCKAAFYRKQDYCGHMRSHRNVRPFTCNHCGCQFIRKYNCLRHMKEHETDKKYTCTICNKTFHRGYYLKDHMRVHDGSRPFSCHICGKASTTKSNHNKHVRIHHAREPQNTEI